MYIFTVFSLILRRMHTDDYDSMQLSWSQFSKESLPDRNFTFWDWFYAIMKLTREHLKSLWVDGYVLYGKCIYTLKGGARVVYIYRR